MQHTTDTVRYGMSPKAKFVFIIFSLILAFVFNLIPYTGIWLLIRPEFLMLTLIYWMIYQPERIGVFSILSCGLLMDVGTGDIFGQHAFAYLAGMLLIAKYRRRLRTYVLGHQLIYVLLSLFITHCVLLLTKLLMGYEWIGWSYFLSLATELVSMPFLWAFLKYADRKQSQQLVNIS